jgi:hypothetical protein
MVLLGTLTVTVGKVLPGLPEDFIPSCNGIPGETGVGAGASADMGGETLTPVEEP